MEEQYLSLKVNFVLNEGETLPTNKKLQGTACVNEDKTEMTFRQNKKSEKSYPKNPAQFTGEHTVARILKNSDYRLTTSLVYNYDFSKDKNIDSLVDEFREALIKLRDN